MEIKRMRLRDYFKLNDIKDDHWTSEEKTDVMFVDKRSFSLMTRIYNRVNLVMSLISLRIAIKKMVIFLIYDNDKLAGFSYFILNHPFAELGIYLNLESRNKGLGTGFIKFMLDWTKKNGYMTQLSVMASNKRAIAVYKKNGMKVYDKRLYMS